MALHSVLCVSFVSPSEQYRGGQWGLEGGIENHRTAAFCRETERAETLQSAAEKVDREEYGWKLQSYEGVVSDMNVYLHFVNARPPKTCTQGNL